MYVEKKLVLVLIAAAVVVLGALGWTIVSLQATVEAARDADAAIYERIVSYLQSDFDGRRL